MLLFKGETLTVKVSHNVISELIRLNKTDYSGAINLSSKDPYGWVRDVVYCSLRVYKPSILGQMTKYEVGDEIFKLSADDLTAFLKDLLTDFVQAVSDGDTKKVASEKK